MSLWWPRPRRTDIGLGFLLFIALLVLAIAAAGASDNAVSTLIMLWFFILGWLLGRL